MKSAALTFICVAVALSGCNRRTPSEQQPANPRAEVAAARRPDANSIVTRRIWSGPKCCDGTGSPDGRYFAYVDWETGDLAVRDLVAGTDRRLTNKGTWMDSDENALNPVMSPDGKQVAYNWSGSIEDLRVVGLDGGQPRILYSKRNPSFWLSSWSSDGKYLIGVLTKEGGTRQIALVSVADGSVRLLKTVECWGGKLATSPNGQYLLYEECSPGPIPRNRDVFLLTMDGKREVALVNDPARDSVLGWVDDQTVLFASDRSGTVGAWALTLVDGKPSGAPRLVKPDLWRTEPGWSGVNGSYYYIVTSEMGDSYTATVDLQTGKALVQPTSLTHGSGGSPPSGQSPDWSPDGRYLAHITGGPSTPYTGVTIRSVETGEVRELKPQMTMITLRWFPDGRSLVAQGTDYQKHTGYHRIDSQTGAVTLIREDSHSGGLVPAVSPDGKTMFFVTRDLDATGFGIVERNLASGKERELYRAKGFCQTLALSSDGRQLAFSTQTRPGETAGIAADRVLYVMPAAGGEPRAVYRAPEQNWIPIIGGFAWTPDGRSLLFVTSQATSEGEPCQLWRIRLDGGKPQKLDVAMDHILGLRVHPDGRRIAFSAGLPKHELWVMENLLPAARGQAAPAQR